MNSDFKENEIVRFERYDKKKKQNVIIEYPVVGGRLRLFHEDVLKGRDEKPRGIECSLVKYEGDVAVMQATVTIDGNRFTGIGMSSKSRDSLIFPAILEMAETRAIARALRFAGYGVEYTGAEEMQGLKKFDNADDVPPSDIKQSQYVNDEPAVTNQPPEQPDNVSAPSKKRQVWELVTSNNPTVQENYLADAVLSFVTDTLAKYDSKDTEMVYSLILENQDLFLNSFKKYIARAVPEIKAPAVEKEPSSEYVDKTPEVWGPTTMPLAQEDQAALNKLRKDAADKMTVDPPPPAVDPIKVAKANIYRAVPDGVSVAALNGTLKSLVEKNQDVPEGEIYKMVLADIDGFMILLDEWSKNNNFPPKSEGKEPKSEVKSAIADAAFRKSWVRLDLENFHKFIIQNADVFKSSKEEYELAVAKFDRLKSKSPDTENLVFPYMFSYEDVKIDTSKSVLEIGNVSEIEVFTHYFDKFPVLVGSISVDLDIDHEVPLSEVESEKVNEEVEKYLMNFEAKEGRPYEEE